MAIYTLLHEVCIEEEEQNRGQRGALWQPSLWQALRFGCLSVDLDSHGAIRAKGFNPAKQALWHAPCSQSLDESLLVYSIIGSFDIKAHKAKDPSASPGSEDLLLQQHQGLLSRTLLASSKVVCWQQSVYLNSI